MSERLNCIVHDVTNYILQKAQVEAEIKLGLRLKQPMFNHFCFVCKDDEGVAKAGQYLENEYGFELLYKYSNGSYLYRSQHGEEVDILSCDVFKRTKASKWQMIFIERGIDNEVYDKAIVNTMWIGDIIPCIEPASFALPKE